MKSQAIFLLRSVPGRSRKPANQCYKVTNGSSVAFVVVSSHCWLTCHYIVTASWTVLSNLAC